MLRRANYLMLALCVACSSTPAASSDAGSTDAGSDVAVATTDPLSMPEIPTLKVADFAAATTCKDCHAQQFAEWNGSRHAYAVNDPVWQVLVGLRQKAENGLQDRFCTQCHSVLGVRSGEIKPGFAFADLTPTVKEGVTCTVCHQSDSVARTHNAGLTMASDGKMRGNLAGVQATPGHESTAGTHLAAPDFCASCHDVIEINKLPLERPYEEWLDSPASGKGQTCQDCHMAKYDGQAAKDGPARTGLHSHRFIGLDPPGAATGSDAQMQAQFAADRDQLLASAAKITLGAGPIQAGQTMDVTVNLENRIAGHSLPTGTTFLRQCWIEVIATDDAGKVLYETGTLDANGDLRDRWSDLAPYADHDLVSLSSSLIDAEGNPTLFPWLAVEHKHGALRAGESKTWTFFVPVPAAATGAVHLTARLRLRSYPPFLFRFAGAAALIPTIVVYDLAADATQVNLP